MTKKDYQVPDVELIGLATCDICDISINGLTEDGGFDWGGEDDGSNEPQVNRWDHFDDKL